MSTPDPEALLRFWFPPGSESPDPDRLEWWFAGGADAEIRAHWGPLLQRGARGELDAWADAPRSRLALILVFDQLPRTLHRDTPEAYAYDPRALALALEGLANGHYEALASPWPQTFFFLPLGHSEVLAHQERAVALTRALADAAPPAQRAMLEHSARQARGHRDVIARFGRHPHRNAVLGRVSTADERAYLERGELIHTRRPPR
jgi:uncharacterized protein (DUF924 family)